MWSRLKVPHQPQLGTNPSQVWIAERQHLLTTRSSTCCVAYYRGWAQFATVIYAVSLLAISGAEFFNYLTNWGNVLNAICFNMLSASHFFEGHHDCRGCHGTGPRRWHINHKVWKIVNFCYELTATVILEITVCYWFLVFPFFVWGPEWPDPYPDPHAMEPNAATVKREKAILLTYLAFAHSIPAAVVLVDLRWSAI